MGGATKKESSFLFVSFILDFFITKSFIYIFILDRLYLQGDKNLLTQ